MIATASDGTRLHFTLAGAGPPLVLIGGKTSTIEGAWWRYIPVLSQHLKVIALESRGAGESDKPDFEYTTAIMAEDACAVLAAAGESSAHWFGISLGGMILQQLALAHPDAVRSLILTATHCGNAGPGTHLPSPPELAGSVLARYANLYDASFIRDQPEWVAEDAKRFGKMPLHAIHRQDQAVRNHRSCERLGDIAEPTLIIHGRGDRMVPVRRAEELAAGIPASELHVLEPAGHQVHSEQFETVVALVLRFIERVEESRRG
ncbi:MAG: alpha/beta hydrolase [Candidatus Dormibacteria bacterium]